MFSSDAEKTRTKLKTRVPAENHSHKKEEEVMELGTMALQLSGCDLELRGNLMPCLLCVYIYSRSVSRVAHFEPTVKLTQD